MMLDESEPLVVETGEIIPPGKWIVRHEDDGDGNVYYTDKNGRCWGTQEGEVWNLKLA